MNTFQRLCSHARRRANVVVGLALVAVCLISLSAQAATTAVSPNRFQGIDPNTGAPLAGGTVEAFTCGTSTPANMYSDASGTVAGTSVTLDGGGQASIWLDPATCYKIRLKDSSGSVLWTLDGVNTAAAGNFTTLAASGAVTLAGALSVTGTASFGVITTSSSALVANLNASQLESKTWEIPGSIGSTTPNAGAFTTLSATGAATVGGNAGLATATFTGAVTRYNNVVLTGDGLSYEVATVDLTAQTAAVTTTTLYAVPASGAGQYTLSWNAKVTTAAGTSSTLGALTIVYTDPDGVAQTITAGAQTSAGAIATTSATNTTAAVLLGLPMLINAKASTNITYAFAYASNAANAMNYNLHIKLRK